MSSANQQSCPNCANPFTEHNPPRRLINCNHLMCQRCLISQKNCKRCGADVGLNDHFLKDYVIVSFQELEDFGEQEDEKVEEFDSNEEENVLLEEQDDKQLLKEQQRDEFYVQECLLHSKPADLICLDDRAIICSSCALFGKHKGHEVANREGVLTKFTAFVEDCLKTYDELKDQNKKFSSQIYRNDYKKIMADKRQMDQKRVKEKFEALISMIKVIEKKQLLKINELYKQRQRICETRQPRLEKVEIEINKWLNQVENIGFLMSDTSSLQKISDCIPYIHQKSNSRTEIILKGEKLLERFSEVRGDMLRQIKEERQTQFIKFDDQKLKGVSQYVLIKGGDFTVKRAQSVKKVGDSYPKSPICPRQMSMKFKSSSKKEHLRTETDAFAENFNSKLRSQVSVNCFMDDNLLLSVEHPRGVFEKLKDPYLQRVKIAEEVDVETIPQLSISDIRPVTNMSSGQSSDQSRFLLKDRELRELVNDGFCGLTVQINKEEQKKKKKVDFPQKFRGIIDDLKNDRAETIDLTGAEAGDGSILSLCPFIKKAKKLKVLKLVKNKLTDDCLTELFEAVAESKVSSLNLSQNLLTDKSCLIISASSIPQTLKTITLSLNKINKRSVKTKIDELGKKSVAILL